MKTFTSTAPPPGAQGRPVEHLNLVRRLVEEQYTGEEPLTRAALHLIDCARDIVAQLPAGDLDAARHALGSARAAVVSATCAVGMVHDKERA
ncbi:hypothetical protein IAG44_03960 [Streptomyces roseirectus]|uniref:Uncharacterized protein n=1 Tax=Streptomyces roseirectus TaxID=2768066 RepID=A0A7H0I7D2_9ACTN|nr:hypothetical protein [Streptomyces roseirectus]QNP68698.1 hypothetical protein IAG44_03960 [Streptomyces roseirectus]